MLNDYEAHFDDGLAEGRTEEEVSAALGNPASLARELKNGDQLGAAARICGSDRGEHELKLDAKGGLRYENDGRGPATLIGLAQRGSALDAALINGMAAHALDYDDVSLPMSAHASVVILPALLALAEKRKASGRQVIESFVAGYEAG